ncbi:hypothetical protein B5G52_19695 [Pseudoalteromonas sp. A601]|nr:hypothetical protein B5G52_19695 [Pseudoalteromonas sp. A601]
MGETGGVVSGGQTGRICLARLLLRLALSFKNNLALSGLLRISVALFNYVEVTSFGEKLIRVLLSSTISLVIRYAS